MSRFLGIVRYEYRMAIGRWGVWLGFALASLLSLVPLMLGEWADPLRSRLAQHLGIDVAIWWFAGGLALKLTDFMAVVAGIALADRLRRDWQIGVSDLLWPTSLSRPTYVLGKYAGAMLAVLTPVVAAWLVSVVLLVARGVPIAFVGPASLAFLAIVVPAYVFLGAFSLACPAVLPVRVYQVLFTGYWFWGNFVNPSLLPTLAGTWLTPSGNIMAAVFFGGGSGIGGAYSAVDASGSLVVILGGAALALVALERYLGWQERRA